uniref:Uncharacterized protein n=1 Tax=Rhizophora mucronata TaxID=61149 RepID=A0A2P2J8Q4_RHIMU
MGSSGGNSNDGKELNKNQCKHVKKGIQLGCMIP